jgi:hypothetical protein
MLKRISLEEAVNYQILDPESPTYDREEARFFTLTPGEDGWEKVNYYSPKARKIKRDGDGRGNAKIYVMSNPSMPGLLKIGYTGRTAKKRKEELDKHSGVPTPFIIEYVYQYYGGEDFERLIHRELAEYRESNDREFFNLEVEEAISMIKEIVNKNVA